MNAFERKIALRVLSIHVGVVLFCLLVATLKGCFRPKPKPEMVTYIDFGRPAPAVQVEEVADQPDPQPEPDPQPDPQPEPEPVKPVVPEQSKKTIQPPKPMDQPKPEPKKKWTPTKVDPSKAKRIKPAAPPKPALSTKDIDRAFSDVTEKSSGPVGSPSEIAAYDALIQSVFHNAWNKPAAPALRPAQVTISISADGRIRSARLSRSSGDAGYDATVQAAAGRVKMLPRRPPKGYPLNNIVVNFKIVD